MYRLLFVLIILVLPVIVMAQNMIPDPGFEDWNGTIGANPNTLGGLNLWYEVNGTPDHHHILNPPGSNLTSLDTTCATGNGQNQCGFPCEGLATLGSYKGNGIDGTKEWAGIQMTEPMIPGACYEVSFWIQNKKDNPSFIMETNQWGVFFSDTPSPAFDPNTADFDLISDQWVATDQLIDGSEWHEIVLTYQASGAYEYAYVGYMGNVVNSTTNAWSMSGSVGFYVWYDKVSVVPLGGALYNLSDDVEICQGDSVELVIETDLPVNWNNGLSTDTSLWVSPNTTTTYYVQGGGGTLCGFTDSVIVTVSGLTLFQPSAMCPDGMPVDLMANLPGGTWSGTGIIDPLAGTFDPSVAGTGIFTVEYDIMGSCTENSSMDIEVLEAPTAGFDADVVEGCKPLMVSFENLNSVIGGSYLWDLGNGFLSVEEHPVQTYSTPGLYDITLSITDASGCTGSVTAENYIEVFPQPVAEFFTNPVIGKVNENILFTNDSENDVQWLWDFGDGNFSDLESPVYTYTAAGTYLVQLSIESEHGCTETTSQIIEVVDDLVIYVPNSFTPNGDGRNDFFQVVTSGELSIYKLRVFDRWGQEIFVSEDPQDRWNGSINGNNYYSNASVFSYIIEYSEYSDSEDAVTNQIFGSITMIR